MSGVRAKTKDASLISDRMASWEVKHHIRNKWLLLG